MRERLREELGGTYFVSVYANLQSSARSTSTTHLDLLSAAIPDRVKTNYSRRVIDEVEWLRDGGDQELLDTVKELFRTPREEQLRDNNFWRSQIRSIAQGDGDFSVIHRFEEWLDAITLDQVVAAAQQIHDAGPLHSGCAAA